MRISILSRYGRLGASSRLRTIQYEKVLQSHGLMPSFHPFFDDEYLEHLYARKSTVRDSLIAYQRRLLQLLRARKSDLIWLEKETFPWLPWPLEWLFHSHRPPIAVDFDDAVFHRYDQHQLKLVRWALGRKIDHVMASAALVTAGNRYLADRAWAAGARRVEIVPTVVDLNSYAVREGADLGTPKRIGWIGTPGTWTEYMAGMMGMLSQVALNSEARIVAVGAGKAADADPLLDVLPWSEDTEAMRIQGMDIGVMPLSDTPWARGKCGYKLIQYMACGIPVVASPVGVNTEIVEHGVNGFLASTEAEWREALMTLLRDDLLRRQMGEAGRRKVEKHYSLQVWGPRVANLLREVAEQGRP